MTHKNKTIFLKDIVSNLKRHRKSVLFVVFGIALITAFSFGAEYFTNAAKEIPKEYREKIVIKSDEIDKEGFINNNNGDLVSLKKKAKIVIDEKYAKVLRIYLTERTETKIEVFSGKDQIYSCVENAGPWAIKTSIYTYELNAKNDDINITTAEKGTEIQRIVIDNTYCFNKYKFIFFFAVGSLVLFFILIIRWKFYKPEIVFLVCALSLTILMSFLLPATTMNSFDEHIHYTKAVSIDDDTVRKSDVDFGNLRIPHFYDTGVQESFFLNIDNKKATAKDEFLQGVSKDKSISKLLIQLAYLPSFLATLLGKIIGMSTFAIFIMGRLINGILYSFIVYCGIKKLKSGKILLSVIALFPIQIFLASTYGYDWWVNSFMILGFAYLFSEIQQNEEKIKLKSYLIIIGAFFLACCPKLIYFPVFICIILLGKHKFSIPLYYKMNIIFAFVLAFAVASIFVFPFLSSATEWADPRVGENVNASRQVAYIFENPLEYTKTLLKQLFVYFSANSIADDSVFFAYLGGNIYHGSLMFAITILAAFTDRNKHDARLLQNQNRFFVWSIVFIIVCLFTTALYMSFNSVGADTIGGVQGRYLLPLIFPIFAFMGSKNIINNIRKDLYMAGLIAIPVFLTLYGLGSLVIRYYY